MPPHKFSPAIKTSSIGFQTSTITHNVSSSDVPSWLMAVSATIAFAGARDAIGAYVLNTWYRLMKTLRMTRSRTVFVWNAKGVLTVPSG